VLLLRILKLMSAMQQGQFPWEEFEPLVGVDAPLLVVDTSPCE
jgi:hypothetical protein